MEEWQKAIKSGELWEYKRRIEKELGEWVSVAWTQTNTIHTCFYEGWCAREDVKIALERVEKLVKEVTAKIKNKIKK